MVGLNILFIIIVGSLFHFIFDWCGRPKWIAWLLPTNESVWKHLKMIVYPFLLTILLDLNFCFDNHNYWFAKFISILSACILCAALFYGYYFFKKKSILWLNILIYILAVMAGCDFGYLFLTVPALNLEIVGMAGCMLLPILFILFTYFAPERGIFVDPLTGKAGIFKNCHKK